MFDRCWLWRKKLTRRNEGTLPVAQWVALEAHLSHCTRCQNADQGDRALREALRFNIDYDRLDSVSAVSFDDRIIAALDLNPDPVPSSRVFSRGFSRGFLWGFNRPQWPVWARTDAFPLTFLTQIAGGAIAAASITALCLVPALHQNQNVGRSVHRALPAEFGHPEPPVSLESLLQTSSPRAVLLWNTPGLHLRRYFSTDTFTPDFAPLLPVRQPNERVKPQKHGSIITRSVIG